MEPEQPVEIDTLAVACDGGGGALGHPNVYLHVDDAGLAVCPYCSRQFVFKGKAAAAGGH